MMFGRSFDVEWLVVRSSEIDRMLITKRAVKSEEADRGNGNC
jgi:hypothetical protein